MNTPYVNAFGSYISYAPISNGSIGSYVKVMYTIDLASPEPNVGKITITNNDSPNNSHEYAPGLTDPGTMEFQVVFDAAKHVPVLNMVGDLTIRSWQETFKDGTTCTFPGYVEKANLDGKTEDGAMMGKVSIQATTAPTWVAGTSGS